jgi:hypothetical protein
MMAYDLVLGSNLGILKLPGPEARWLNCGHQLGIPEMSKLSLHNRRQIDVCKMVLLNNPQLNMLSS